MKKAKCFKCKKTIKLPMAITRDQDDRLDIFNCSLCGTNFKIDVIQYSKNRKNKNYTIRTFSHNKKILNEMDRDEEESLILKYWWVIFIILGIIVILDDMRNGRF